MCGREEGDAALEAIKQKLMDRGVAEDVAEQQLSTEVQLVAPSCSRQTCDLAGQCIATSSMQLAQQAVKH